jgi:hypothetical protein
MWHTDFDLDAQAMLAGGTWHRLLSEDHPGLLEVKWCVNRFTPFLVIDPQVSSSRDLERAKQSYYALSWF